MSPEILALLAKGIDLIITVASNEDLVTRAGNALAGLLSKDKPTQAAIDAAEADFDAMLAEFNAPLPPD